MKIYFDYSLELPDLEGSVVILECQELSKKVDCTSKMLDVMDSMRKSEDICDEMKALILVPNGLVSIIIGTKGKQINHLIKESGANIIVNQPIFKMLHRTLTISGKVSKISNAIMEIHKLMEDRYYEVQSVEIECKPLDLTKTRSSAKVIVNHYSKEYLDDKRSDFLKKIKKKFGTDIKIYQERNNKAIHKNEYVIVWFLYLAN